jgi:hypothetical protein
MKIKNSWDSITFRDNNKGKVLDTCLLQKANLGWLWHQRLTHVGMRNPNKLKSVCVWGGGHILRLTDVVFERNRPYRAYQARK